MAEHRADKKDGWQRYDWDLIETVYVCSIPGLGLRKIAKRFGCNIKTVERHSKKDNWYQKRIDFLNDVIRGAQIEYYMKHAEQACLEIINEDRAAYGLDPIDDIGKKMRAELREELEKMF